MRRDLMCDGVLKTHKGNKENVKDKTIDNGKK